MSLLPPDASFAERVADLFTAFRGSGLMLSALDAELLARWSQAGVPVEVVARGIRKAAEKAAWDQRPGEPRLRSLRACQRQVDAEIAKHHSQIVGQPEDRGAGAEVFHQRHRRMAAALRRAAEAHALLSPTVETILRGPLRNLPRDFEEAQRQEDWAIALVLRALPFPNRLAILRWGRISKDAVIALPAEARKSARRFHRAAAVRRHLSLPIFW